MATFFDWTKLVVSNKLLLVMLLTSIGSVGTNIGQLFGSYEQDAEIQASQEQIAVIANHYVQTTTPKIVVQTSPCGECMRAVKQLREEFH